MKKIGTAQVLAMLKHLIDGNDGHEVAVMMHLDYNDVVHTVSAYGYPDVEKMRKAAAIVERRLDREERAIPETDYRGADAQAARDRLTKPSRPVETAKIRSVSLMPEADPESGVHPVTIGPAPEVPGKVDVLLRKAAATEDKQLGKVVDRIWQLVGDLEQRLDARLAREREKAEAEQKREAAKQRVEKAKAELAAAQAALRAQSQGAKPADIRAWAKAQGLDLPSRGKLPHEVREAYARAHQSEAS